MEARHLHGTIKMYERDETVEWMGRTVTVVTDGRPIELLQRYPCSVDATVLVAMSSASVPLFLALSTLSGRRVRMMLRVGHVLRGLKSWIGPAARQMMRGRR